MKFIKMHGNNLSATRPRHSIRGAMLRKIMGEMKKPAWEQGRKNYRMSGLYRILNPGSNIKTGADKDFGLSGIRNKYSSFL